MKSTIRLFAVLATIFALMGAAFGQAPEVQTKNIPAGTVVDRGSELLYIADTGINLRTEGLTNETDNVAELLFGNSSPAPGETLVNFISVTNTHPTKAVTVHFRYYNDECEDVLDFLVVLTCNDTLLFNPFDFEIPGAQLEGAAVNTGRRIFGPDISSAFPAIPASQFLSGRFIIVAVAAGTVRLDETEPTGNGGFGADEYAATSDPANILFPRELAGGDCNFVNSGSFAPDGSRNVGAGSGFSVDNLHVFNAAAVSFNHLIGHHTIATPPGLSGTLPGDAFLAFGINAWTRPAVDLTVDANSDGDGPPIADYCLLTGGEVLWDSTTRCTLNGGGAAASGVCTAAGTPTNNFYLRSEVHGGTLSGTEDAARVDYGALGWTSLHSALDRPAGTGLAGQRVEFMSIFDDYNGSTNSGFFTVLGTTTFDRAHAVRGAETHYIVQLFDNNEDQLTLTGQEPILISPAPVVPPLSSMRIVVDCLNVWTNGTRSSTFQTDGGASLDDLAIVAEVTTGGTGFPNSYDGLLGSVNPLQDASQGWIRFVRDNTAGGTRLLGQPRNGEFVPASFVTIGQVVLKFEGFGASWWLATSTQDRAISDADIADPTPVTLP